MTLDAFRVTVQCSGQGGNPPTTLLVPPGSPVIVAELERGAPDSNIDSLPDGLWWAATTVTTVGYGDTFPTTAAGRAFAVVLMLIGVGLFGLLAASLASFLVERGVEKGRGDPEHVEIIERLERIERRLDAGGEHPELEFEEWKRKHLPGAT